MATGCLTGDETEELGATEQALNGDTWLTSDLLQSSPYPLLYDAAIGSGHQIFTVGTRSGSDADSWEFRTSTNGGITYASGPSYTLGANVAQAEKIVVDHIGRIFVAGTARDMSGNFHVITRMSTNQGASFTTVDNVMFPAGEIRGASSLTFDETGVFTLAINGPDAPSLLRRSTGGLGWSTLANPTPFVKIRGLCRTTNGMIATGQSSLASTGVTYRYKNGTWALLDSFNTPNDDTGWQCSEVNGALFVAGKMGPNLFVRRSTNGGSTWSTVDSIPGVNVKKIGPGANGRVYYVGQGGDGTWLVRRSANGTTWLDSDLTGQAANGFAYDSTNGSMTVVGDDGTANSTGVRRLKL